MRTGTPSWPFTSPRTIATCSKPLRRSRKTMMRNSPCSVGSVASLKRSRWCDGRRDGRTWVLIAFKTLDYEIRFSSQAGYQTCLAPSPIRSPTDRNQLHFVTHRGRLDLGGDRDEVGGS